MADKIPLLGSSGRQPAVAVTPETPASPLQLKTAKYARCLFAFLVDLSWPAAFVCGFVSILTGPGVPLIVAGVALAVLILSLLGKKKCDNVLSKSPEAITGRQEEARELEKVRQYYDPKGTKRHTTEELQRLRKEGAYIAWRYRNP